MGGELASALRDLDARVVCAVVDRRGVDDGAAGDDAVSFTDDMSTSVSFVTVLVPAAICVIDAATCSAAVASGWGPDAIAPRA